MRALSKHGHHMSLVYPSVCILFCHCSHFSTKPSWTSFLWMLRFNVNFDWIKIKPWFLLCFLISVAPHGNLLDARGCFRIATWQHVFDSYLTLFMQSLYAYIKSYLDNQQIPQTNDFNFHRVSYKAQWQRNLFAAGNHLWCVKGSSNNYNEDSQNQSRQSNSSAAPETLMVACHRRRNRNQYLMNLVEVEGTFGFTGSSSLEVSCIETVK